MVLVHIRTVFDHKRHNQYILCHYLAFISRRFESYVILSEHIMANAWHVGIYSMSHLVKCCNKVSWYHGCVWWPLSLSLCIYLSIYLSNLYLYIGPLVYLHTSVRLASLNLHTDWKCNWHANWWPMTQKRLTGPAIARKGTQGKASSSLWRALSPGVICWDIRRGYCKGGWWVKRWKLGSASWNCCEGVCGIGTCWALHIGTNMALHSCSCCLTSLELPGWEEEASYRLQCSYAHWGPCGGSKPYLGLKQ